MEQMILASASPRRLELLRQVGIEPVVEPSHVQEVITSTIPGEVVMELSRQKAEDIAGLHRGVPVIVLEAKGSGGRYPYGKASSGPEPSGLYRSNPGVLWRKFFTEHQPCHYFF